MPRFEIQLQSQTDRQSRVVTAEAVDAAAARAFVEDKERRIAAFSLMPPSRDVWEQPPGGPDSPDGIVDLARWDAYDPAFARHAATLSYRAAVRAANDRLARLAGKTEVRPDGKVRGRLTGRALARYQAHLQPEPYVVVDVRETVDLGDDTARLVADAARLYHRLTGEPNGPAQWLRVLEQLREQGIPTNAVTAALLGLIWQDQIEGSSTIVWSSNTIAIPLLTGYTADVDTHDFWNDLVSTEIANGNGYTTNGATLGSKTSTYDTATDQVRLDGADTSWAASTISATDAAIVNRTPGTDATRPVLGVIDFGATVSTTAGTFQITWDATGIINFDLT